MFPISASKRRRNSCVNRQIDKHHFHRLASLLLEANSHHGTDNGTADSTCIADPSCERTGYPRNHIVLCLYPEFLAHGQKDRLRSNVTLTHKLRGGIVLHNLLLFFPVSLRLLHHQWVCNYWSGRPNGFEMRSAGKNCHKSLPVQNISAILRAFGRRPKALDKGSAFIDVS